MGVTTVHIDEAFQIVPCEPDVATALSQQANARVWIDLHALGPSDFEAWLDKLDVRGLIRRLCVEAGDRSGIYPLKREMLLVVPVLAQTPDGLSTDHVGMLCRENLLVTWHQEFALNPSQHAALHEAEAWLPNRSIAGLVSALLVDLSQEGLRHTVTLRRLVRALEERMDRDPDAVEAVEILDLRAALLAQDSAVSDQLPPSHTLGAMEKPYFRQQDSQEYMNCALANLDAADRAIDRLGQRVNDLRAGFQMHSQDKTNRRLGMLTILSAIFMPITLMAGIWGMNFEGMPELNLRFGYPLGLGLMVLVGVGMYHFFHRGGWFD
jgi:Mg2+ and Co2+ transporter CorA